jgi:hypothetical protein
MGDWNRVSWFPISWIHAAPSVTGVLRRNTITLDAPVPALDGQRVRVIIAPEDLELALQTDEQARVWHDWLRQGPQGPLDDEGEQEFP